MSSEAVSAFHQWTSRTSRQASGCGLVSRLLVAHRPGPRQHLPVVEPKELVQPRCPIPQEHLRPSAGLVLGEIQPHHDDPVELPDLIGVQVVLRDGHVALPDPAPGPARQAHVGPGVIGPIRDQFGGGLSGCREMKLVLDHLEERRHIRSGGVVVRSEREDLAHPEVHARLAGADVANALKQLIEVVRGR